MNSTGLGTLIIYQPTSGKNFLIKTRGIFLVTMLDHGPLWFMARQKPLFKVFYVILLGKVENLYNLMFYMHSKTNVPK